MGEITSVLLLGVAGMYVPIGLGVCFYGFAEHKLISSGMLRKVVTNSWKQRTMWAAKPSLIGSELKPLVETLTSTDQFKLIFLNKYELTNPFIRRTYDMVVEPDIVNALVAAALPFKNSEKLVSTRLTQVLVQAVEEQVLSRIQSKRDQFLYLSLVAVLMGNALILAFDRQVILDTK